MSKLDKGRCMRTLLIGHIRESTLPQKQWEATDVFSARMMTRSHLVFGKMTPQQYGNDRLMRQRGIRESGQDTTYWSRGGGWSLD